MFSLLHLDFAKSWAENPLVAALILSVAVILLGSSRLAERVPRLSTLLLKYSMVPVFIALAYTGVVRNL